MKQAQNKEIELAYEEFIKSLDSLRQIRQTLFTRAIKDLEKISIQKTRKELGVNE